MHVTITMLAHEVSEAALEEPLLLSWAPPRRQLGEVWAEAPSVSEAFALEPALWAELVPLLLEAVWAAQLSAPLRRSRPRPLELPLELRMGAACPEV